MTYRAACGPSAIASSAIATSPRATTSSSSVCVMWTRRYGDLRVPRGPAGALSGSDSPAGARGGELRLRSGSVRAYGRAGPHDRRRPPLHEPRWQRRRDARGQRTQPVQSREPGRPARARIEAGDGSAEPRAGIQSGRCRAPMCCWRPIGAWCRKTAFPRKPGASSRRYEKTASASISSTGRRTNPASRRATVFRRYLAAAPEKSFVSLWLSPFARTAYRQRDEDTRLLRDLEVLELERTDASLPDWLAERGLADGGLHAEERKLVRRYAEQRDIVALAGARSAGADHLRARHRIPARVPGLPRREREQDPRRREPRRRGGSADARGTPERDRDRCAPFERRARRCCYRRAPSDEAADAFRLVLAAVLLGLCTLAIVRWQIAVDGGVGAQAATDLEDARRTLTYLPTDDGWMTFPLRPARSALRIVTTANFDADAATVADAPERLPYVLEYRLIDADGGESERSYHEAATLDPASSPTASIWICPTRPPPRRSCAWTSGSIPRRIRVRARPIDDRIRDIGFRAYLEEPVSERARDTRWQRLTRAQQQRLFAGNLYRRSFRARPSAPRSAFHAGYRSARGRGGH